MFVNDNLFLSLLIFLSILSVAVSILLFIVFWEPKKKMFSEERWKIFENEMNEDIRKKLLVMDNKMTEEFGGIIDLYKKRIAGVLNKINDDLTNVNKFESEVRDKLLKSVEQQIKKLNQSIKSESAEISEIDLHISNLVDKEVKKDINEMGKSIDEETEQVVKLIGNIVKQKNIEVSKAIEAYKEKRLKDLDGKIYQLVGDIAKEIIGNEIDVSSHKELVMKALEQAKKEIF